ncbi:MAG: hypothetical protein WBM40_15965 [Thiohalocapsa sp.]|jgi:hypothetical protein
MRSGYLTIETHPAYPDVLRLSGMETLPPERPDSLKYAARFNDLDAALMHFHSALRRRLVDVDRRLYRGPAASAVAAADAIELPHRRIFIDPELQQDPAVAESIERLHRSHHRWERFFDLIGLGALLLLLAIAFL